MRGETVAAALTAAGRLDLGRAADGHKRGLFCGMGVCQDCLVGIDDGPSERACLTKVSEGMRVYTLDYRTRVPEMATGFASKPSDTTRHCDVLVVGAGPAGLALADVVAREKLAVVVVDERPEPGGQYFKQLALSYGFKQSSPTDAQYANGRE
ncbi:MAG: 2Fe-2S iron-sulfur cluster-binding protein, partial [Gammaproteobacteria bacterium]